MKLTVAWYFYFDPKPNAATRSKHDGRNLGPVYVFKANATIVLHLHIVFVLFSLETVFKSYRFL